RNEQDRRRHCHQRQGCADGPGTAAPREIFPEHMPIYRNIMSGEVEQMRVLPGLVVVLTLHSVCFACGPYRLRVLVKEGDTIGGGTTTARPSPLIVVWLSS